MKIGIMGTHGVGKTTFAMQMAASLKKACPGENVSLLAEVTRLCPFPVNKNTSPEAQLWIFHRQMITEIEMAAQNEILICDRTILDSFAYSLHAGFNDIVDAYLPIAVEWLKKTYDEVYFIRQNNRPCADDGFRNIDPKFQKEIEIILESWLDMFNISTKKHVPN